MLTRRSLVKFTLAVSAAAALIVSPLTSALAQEKVVRIGFQKYGKLVLLKSKGTLEPKLKALGYSVAWTEFPSGPPLLEALNVGAIDFGNTGEAPPIFAQAAGAPIQYVAYEPPAPKGEAILVPKDLIRRNMMMTTVTISMMTNRITMMEPILQMLIMLVFSGSCTTM